MSYIEKILKFGTIVNILGVVAILGVAIPGLLYFPLAILWVGPFFAFVAMSSGVWGWFKSPSPDERRKVQTFLIKTLLLYLVIFSIGLFFLGVLADSLFF